jgi:hypothetical protein
VSQLHKGALIRYASHLPNPRIVPFMFNPERLARNQSGGRDFPEPVETIRFGLKCHVSGLDEFLGQSDDSEERLSVYPLLAALEELLARQASSPIPALPFINGGQRPYSFLTFRWGKRELPVELQRLDIRERMFTQNLMPVYATVEVQLRVLNRSELEQLPEARELLTQYKKQRRQEAINNSS